MKYYLTLTLLFLVFQFSFSQYISDIVTGDWEDDAVWTGGNPAPDTDVLDDDVEINGKITRNGSVDFYLGNDLVVNDTLIITGDLTTAVFSSITVATDGVLIILGDMLGFLSFGNIDGIVAVVGNVIAPISSYNNDDGDVYVFDNVIPPSSFSDPGSIGDSSGLAIDYPGLSDEINDLITGYSCSTAPTSASSSDDNFCQGAVANITLSYSGGVRSTTAIATWYDTDPTIGSPANIGTDQDLFIAAPATTTTYYVRFEGDPGVCGSTVTSAVSVTVTVSQPVGAVGAITGSASVCDGTLGVAYSVPAITNATGYIWSLPTGASIATGTNTNSITVDFAAGASSGNITVQGTNACGNGAISPNFTVTVNSTPTVNDIADLSTCDSYALPAITGTNLTGNEAYFTGTGGTGTQYNATDVVSSTSTLYIYDATGTTPNCSSEEIFTVTVNALPATTLNASATTICSGDSVTFTAGGGNEYEFYVDGVSVQAQSATNTYTTTGLSNGESVTVRAVNTATGCDSTSAGIMVTVNVLPTVTASNNGPVCSGSDLLLSATSSGATSWQWSSNGSATFSDNTVSNPIVSGAMDGEVFTVEVSNGTCTNTATTVASVDASTLTLNVTNNGPICSGSDLLLSATSSGATSWQWSSNGSATFNDNTVSNPIVSGAVDGEVFTIEVSNGTCTNTATTVASVDASTLTLNVSNSGPVCSGANLQLSAEAPGATSWQ